MLISFLRLCVGTEDMALHVANMVSGRMGLHIQQGTQAPSAIPTSVMSTTPGVQECEHPLCPPSPGVLFSPTNIISWSLTPNQHLPKLFLK